MDLPFVSLYIDTFPEITGVSNTSHALAIPSAEVHNSQKPSGLSGEP